MHVFVSQPVMPQTPSPYSLPVHESVTFGVTQLCRTNMVTEGSCPETTTWLHAFHCRPSSSQ